MISNPLLFLPFAAALTAPGKVKANLKREWIILAALVALAAVLRFAGLGKQPLWLDEASTAEFAARPLYDCIFADTQHPPLFDVLLHFSIRVFGASDAALRIPSAIFGVLLVPVVWVLARRFASHSLFLRSASAALTAASPFLIYLSQEARSYSLFILLSACATLAFLRLMPPVAATEAAEPAPVFFNGALAFYAALSAALIYTHYFGALVLLAHELIYWKTSRRRVAAWLTARAAVAAVFLPWAVWLLRQPQYIEARQWLGSPWLRTPYAWFRFLDGFGIAPPNLSRLADPPVKILREEGLAVLLTLAPLVWLLACGLRRAWREPPLRSWIIALLIGPYLPLLALSPWLRLVHERYLAFQAPFFMLLIAAGLTTLRGMGLRSFTAVACTLSITFSLWAYYAAPGRALGYPLRYGKEDWPTAAAWVAAEKPQAVVLAPAYLQFAFARYWKPGPGLPATFVLPDDAGHLPNLAAARRVAIVLSHDGPAEESLRQEIAAGRALAGQHFFPQQTGIRVFVYDAPH